MFKRSRILALLAVLAVAPMALGQLASASHAPPAAAEASAGQEKGGDIMGVDRNQAIWTIAIFLVLLGVLYPTAWKQVLAGLKAREERIRRDIADAEAARLKAEETLKQYAARLETAEQQVRDMLSKATFEGEKIAAQIRSNSQKESEELKQRALRDIEAARKQAVREVYEQGAGLATSVAEKILRRQLNPDDARDLVNQSLQQLQDAASES